MASSTIFDETPSSPLATTRRLTFLIPLTFPSSSLSLGTSIGGNEPGSRRPGILLLILQVPANSTSSSMFQSDAVADEDFDDILNRLMQSFQPRGPPPTSKDFIETLPRITMDSQLQQEQHRCPVCLLDYELDEEVLKLPCTHVFHQDCIETWLKQANTCCVCRHELPKQDDSSSSVSQELDPFSLESPLSSSSSSIESSDDNELLPPLVSEEEIEQMDREEEMDDIQQTSQQIQQASTTDAFDFSFFDFDRLMDESPFEDIPIDEARSAHISPISSPVISREVTFSRQPRIVDDDLPATNQRSSGPLRWLQDRFACFRA